MSDPMSNLNLGSRWQRSAASTPEPMIGAFSERAVICDYAHQTSSWAASDDPANKFHVGCESGQLIRRGKESFRRGGEKAAAELRAAEPNTLAFSRRNFLGRSLSSW